MQRLRRKGTLIIILFFLANIIPVQSKAAIQNTDVSNIKKREAEHFVIGVLRRFGQTLDFKIIFRKFFIKDKSTRRILFESDLKDDNFDLTKFDDVALEKVYVTTQNWYWLDWIYFYRADKKGDYESNNEDSQSLIKRAVFPKLTERRRAIYKFMTDGDQSSKLQDLSKSDLSELLSCYDVAALVVRGHVSQKLRDSLRHKVTVYSWISDKKDESLKKYVNVYNVSAEINGVWGKFEFTVVEESGNMRIASVWIADGKQ